MSKMLLSVVIPVYGAPQCLHDLYKRLVQSLETWTDFELVMVNDHCPLGSDQILEDISTTDQRVKFIDLIRNYGQHVAISAGLDYAIGDYVVVMDCDLQDQPEEIKKLYDFLISNKFEAVYGVRANRQHSLLNRLESRIFGNSLRLLTSDTLKITKDIGNFSIITRKIANAVRLFREKGQLYGVTIARILPEIGFVDVSHAQRAQGKSSYTLWKKIILAGNSLIANSNKPLHFSLYCAVTSFFIATIIGLRTLFLFFFRGVSVSGWTSLMVAMCFFFGIQMLFLGILGAYLGTMSTMVRQRPLYLISRVKNIIDSRINQ
jgi:dolichol-phosphate mannosyltransferase